jgi:hypothetical protein
MFEEHVDTRHTDETETLLILSRGSRALHRTRRALLHAPARDELSFLMDIDMRWFFFLVLIILLNVRRLVTARSCVVCFVSSFSCIVPRIVHTSSSSTSPRMSPLPALRTLDPTVASFADRATVDEASLSQAGCGTVLWAGRLLPRAAASSKAKSLRPHCGTPVAVEGVGSLCRCPAE